MDEIIYTIRYTWKHYKLKIPCTVMMLSLLIDVVAGRYVLSPGVRLSQDSPVPIELATYSLRLVLILLCISSAVIPVMMIRYSDATGGRSCFIDMRETGRTYHELLRYYKDANPYRLDVKDYPVGSWKYNEGVILGQTSGHTICRSAFENGGEGHNYALFAQPGAGKTTCQIIPTALNFAGSILAIDIKGDIYNATHNRRRIKCFCPDEPGNSCHYNPLGQIGKMTVDERRTYLEQMAAVIVPEDKENKYWHETARALFIGISLHCLEGDIGITLPEISKKILLGNAVDWVMTIKDGDCKEAQAYTNSMYGSSEKNISGAYAELAKNVRPFASGKLAGLLDDKGDSLSPESLLRNDIYIIIPQDKIQIYAPISSILLQDFMSFFMRRNDITSGEKKRPVLFLLDEFAQLRIEADYLLAALATLRSKCVSLFLCMQSLAQLSSKYGDNGCQAIMDCCQTISVMSAQDPESRKWFQSLVGTEKVLKVSTNTSGPGDFQNGWPQGGGRSVQEVREHIFQPEDFANLGSKVLIYTKGKYTLADKTPWYK